MFSSRLYFRIFSAFILTTFFASNLVHARVDTRPPTLRIRSAPSGNITATSAKITFAASDNLSGVKAYCSLDGAAYAACVSPYVLSGLSAKAHIARLYAQDRAGNKSAVQSVSFTVVSANPTPTPTPVPTATPTPTPKPTMTPTPTPVPTATPTPKPTPTPMPTATPPAGASGSSPAPTRMGTMYGCTNPYTNNSMNGTNWGASTSRYVNAATMSVIGNMPKYTSNAVFSVSREAGPGVPVLVHGAFTASAKTIRLLAVTAGMMDWQTALRASSITVPATSLSATGLRFQIPANFPNGTYAMRIEDPSAAAVEMLINAPKIEWAMGVPVSADVLEAPKHQLYTCGAEVGSVLRIIGKNFQASPSVILHDKANNYYKLSVSKSDESSISVSVPASLAPGSYYLWIGAPTQDAAASEAYPVTLYAAPTSSLSQMSCSGLVGDGSTDNTSTLQNCLNAAKASSTAASPKYLSLPAGNFVIKNQITINPYQYLIGASQASTTITGVSSAPPSAWIVGSKWFGLQNMTLQGPVKKHFLQSSSLYGDPALLGHALVNNVRIYSGQVSSGDNQTLARLSGPDIRVMNSAFEPNANSNFNVDFGDGVYVVGNNFPQRGEGAVGFLASQNVIFEKNNITGRANEGGGVSFGRPFWEYNPSMINQNIYSCYNTMLTVQNPDAEGFTTDGGTEAYVGSLSAYSASSITTSNDLDYQWVGVTNHQTLAVTIIQGKGVGQYRMVQSISGRTINLAQPWDVVPDASSIISVTSSNFRLNISHNIIKDTIRGGITFYGNAYDSVSSYNDLTNTGIEVDSQNYGVLLHIVGIDLIGNRISLGANTMFPTDPGGSAFFGRNTEGTMVAAVYIRGNYIESGKTFNLANNYVGLTSYLVEANDMVVSPSTLSWIGNNKGVLMQGNK